MGEGGGGYAELRHQCFSVETYAKTKELDPVGGAPAAPPGSANGEITLLIFFFLVRFASLALVRFPGVTGVYTTTFDTVCLHSAAVHIPRP